jgi:NTP pyrophosphatase (non-canonical NTP hydrolase)
MLNKTERLLNLIQEECAEVAQRASKCIRFGLYEAREGRPLNIRLLAEELNDLLTVFSMLDEEVNGDFERTFTEEEAIQWQQDKIEKILKYEEYSRQLGLIE